ncbi:MAG: c-type cytochrome [Gammaproteobacteria bacterium]|nr:c-type cytochrome [Gammaproteobacteria bacterium]
MKNRVVLGLGGLLLAGFLGGAGTVAAAEAEMDKKTLAAIYLKNCSICHGDNGDANTRARSGMFPKPRDFTTAEAAIELTRERMIKSVTEGRPGTAMVGHKGRLSPEQIEGLVDYIRANFMQVATAAVDQPPAAVSVGEKVYTQNCAVCHGDKGNTAFWAQNGLNPPPRDFTAPESLSVLTRSRMLDSVTNGRPGTGMMPFKSRLTGDEISAVVGYIRFKFMGVDPGEDSGAAPLALVKSVDKPVAEPVESTSPMAGIPGVDAPLSSARPATSDANAQAPVGGLPGAPSGHSMEADMSLPVPNGLKGDLAWARTFYMSNCFVCHGVTGQGDGPRAYFNIPRPRNFTSEAARQVLNRPRIFDSITKGRVATVMPAWGKVLTEQQIAGLTEFVFQTFIRPSEAATAPSPADKKKAP